MNKNSNYLFNHQFLENFNALDETLPPKLTKNVHIWDETLRDGAQTPGVNLQSSQKVEIAKSLDEIGISVIAVGFPAISKEEKISVKSISSEGLKAKVAAPGRAIISDINHSIDCNVDEIPIFFPTSDLALKKVIKTSLDEAIQKIVGAVEYSVDHGIITDFIAMDASRTKLDVLDRIFRAVFEVGADKVVIADTVGILRPKSTSYLLHYFKNQDYYKDRCFSIHCHNDFGLANANTLAAIEMGANFPHVCINGYGERSGNCALEELVMSLELQYDVKTNIKMEKLYELSQLTESYFGLPLSIHKPVVGLNSFSHESGLHVNAILTGGPETIEPYSPSVVGRRRKYFVGKYSGRTSIEYISKILKIKTTKEEINEILDEIKKSNYLIDKDSVKTMEFIRKQILKTYSGISAEDFINIIKKVTGKKPAIDKATLKEYSLIF